MKCCEFIFPTLTVGGIMVIDDYGRPLLFEARIRLASRHSCSVIQNTFTAVISRSSAKLVSSRSTLILAGNWLIERLPGVICQIG